MKLRIVLVGCLICLRALALEPAPAGSTPLHGAALRGDAAAVAALIKAGANVNATNAAGATPLHYAAGSERAVELLLGAGANPNALSRSRFTPLFSAAGRQDSYGSVKRLLAAGAFVDPVSFSGEVGIALTPLALAAFSGDERTAALLLEHGASATISNSVPVAMAAYTGRERLLKLLVEHGGSVNCSDNFAGHALNIALYAEHRQLVPYLLTQGIDLHHKSVYGSEAVPPMVWSAYDEAADPSAALALLERGLDVNEPSSSGSTALSWALKRGNTRLVELLRSKGATEESKGLKKKAFPSHALPSDTAGQERMLRDGVQRALGLLQRSSDGFLDNGFVKKSGCVSCHQQTLSAVALAHARERGFQLDETSLARQLTVQQSSWSKTRDAAYELKPPQPDPPIVIGYGLQGLHALGYQPDDLTAAMAWYLAETQLPDGSWPGLDVRPPMEAGQIMGTALTVKALQKYAPPYQTRPVQERIARARHWLEQCQPPDPTQRVFRYLGLGWAGATPSDLQAETRELLKLQRPDGGWAALPALESDAWATGLTLAAFHEVGGLVASHSAYRRGIEFLLRTQYDDGSWWVKSRTWPFQPHFDSGFPHGKDQWISAAGTSWAVIALLNTIAPVAEAKDIPTAQALIAKYSKPGSASPTVAVASAKETAPTAADARFVNEITPIFQKSCLPCHSGEKPKGGLSLEKLAGLAKGGQSGQPAVIPGQPDVSPLLRFVQDQVEDLEMPPLSRRAKYPALTKLEVATLRDWIRHQDGILSAP